MTRQAVGDLFERIFFIEEEKENFVTIWTDSTFDVGALCLCDYFALGSYI